MTGGSSIPAVASLTPYVHFPGTAGAALTFYAEVFGGSVQLHTFEEFQRNDGPSDAVAHGYLDGPVRLFAADAAGDDSPVHCEGLMLALLGVADASTSRAWFSKLAHGGRVVSDLQRRPWGDWDGRVIDRHGLHWLIGFEGDAGT